MRFMRSIFYALQRFKERDRIRRHETDDSGQFSLLRKKDPYPVRIFLLLRSHTANTSAYTCSTTETTEKYRFDRRGLKDRKILQGIVSFRNQSRFFTQ